MPVSAAIEQLRLVKEAMEASSAPMIVVNRANLTELLDTHILLQELARHFYSLLVMVQACAVNPYLIASAELELDKFLLYAVEIEPRFIEGLSTGVMIAIRHK